jgi:hypothetical protein
MWLTNIGEESHFVAPHISESYSQMRSSEGTYFLRLSYSADLKTRNNHISGCLGTPCHSVFMEDTHERWSQRGGGSDMSPLRSLNIRELGE